jgi:sugar phosphate isomerase/epimerase
MPFPFPLASLHCASFFFDDSVLRGSFKGVINRRRFIQQAGVACAAGSLLKAEDSVPAEPEWPIVLFEKPVQNLSYEEIADEVAKMGAQGLEATIRSKGHILPENAARELPALVKTLEAAGLTTIIAASSIIRADDKTSDYLKTLRDNGITQYRTNYYRYSKNGNPMAEVKRFHEQAKALADLNAELGMQALYQIHSGGRFAGSLLWDAALIFENINPDHFAVAYDLRHSKTDCGLSWEVSAQVIRDHIRSIYVKDARWGGDRSDKLKSCPLDTGFVSQEMFDFVREGRDSMPLSLHMEWGDHSLYPKESAREAWPLIRKDMEVLKKWRG